MLVTTKLHGGLWHRNQEDIVKNAVCPWVARSLEVRSCQPFDFQCGRLAQLVRALLSHGRGHRFEFCIAHYVGLLRVCFGFFSAQRASFQIDLRHTWLRRYEAASMPCRTRRRLRWHWRQNGVGQVLLPSINGRSAANVTVPYRHRSDFRLGKRHWHWDIGT